MIILVFIHEGGHYLAAKAFGVRVTEFMIGLPGPSIGFTWKGTRFGIVRYGTDNKITIYEANKPETGKVCEDSDDALEYIVSGDRLRDVITQVTVLDRTI